RHTRFSRDWSSDVCSSDLIYITEILAAGRKPRWKEAVSQEDFARLMKGERPSFVESTADWFQRLIDPPLDGGAPLTRYGCKMAKIGRASCRDRQEGFALGA